MAGHRAMRRAIPCVSFGDKIHVVRIELVPRARGVGNVVLGRCRSRRVGSPEGRLRWLMVPPVMEAWRFLLLDHFGDVPRVFR